MFGNVLTQSPNSHSLALVKLTLIVTLAVFRASNTPLRAKCSPAPLHIPPTNGCHDEETIGVILLSVGAYNVMLTLFIQCTYSEDKLQKYTAFQSNIHNSA